VAFLWVTAYCSGVRRAIASDLSYIWTLELSLLISNERMSFVRQKPKDRSIHNGCFCRLLPFRTQALLPDSPCHCQLLRSRRFSGQHDLARDRLSFWKVLQGRSIPKIALGVFSHSCLPFLHVFPCASKLPSGIIQYSPPMACKVKRTHHTRASLAKILPKACVFLQKISPFHSYLGRPVR
jgi:hypothetical protein